MTLKNRTDDGQRTTDDGRTTNNKPQTTNHKLTAVFRGLSSVVLALLLIAACSFATCKYSFNDTGALPTEVKTFRVNYFENRAEYKNPQLSPQITEKLKQKIIGTTRLRQTNDEDAHYDISGYVSAYYTSSTGISGNNTSLNRLTANFHLIFKNTLDEKKNFEADVTYSIDFNANLSLSQVEQSKGDEIAKNLSDAIFNKIFSNW